MPKEDAVALICELLDAEDEPNVCAAAVESLAEIGGAEALPALTRCAERFRENSFLQFSISVAIDRIRAQDPTLRG
jgi:HEAT repeat protein